MQSEVHREFSIFPSKMHFGVGVNFKAESGCINSEKIIIEL